MKKTLLSTTALVAASFLSLGVASAEVTVSANQTYLLKLKSGSEGGAKLGAAAEADNEDSDVRQSIVTEHETSNIMVKGSGVTDAGLMFGLNIDLNTFVGGTDLDESDVYIGGDSWGKISLGQDDDALDGKTVTGNSVSVGLGGTGSTGDDVSGNGDYARILYNSPNIGGFELAASFAPQAAGDGTEADSENLMAIGAKFSQDFGNFGLSVGGGARIQSLTNRSAAATTSGGIEKDEETGSKTGFQAGVMGSFDGFSVAVGFGSDTATDKTKVSGGDDKETSDTYINAGVAYSFGVGGVSLGYYSVSREVKNVDKAKQSANSIVLDADYKLGEGIKALFQLAIDSSDPNTDDDAKSGMRDPSATTIKLGLNAAF